MSIKSWLYGLIVFLAQTCNPHYNDHNNTNDFHVEIPDEAMELEDDFEVAPPRTYSDQEVPDIGDIPPPPPEPELEKIFQIVEEMPRFPGCEQKAIEKSELKECAEKEMFKFIYQNIKYPKVAIENKIEGNAYVQFTIDKTGLVRDAKVIREPGGGIGIEALRIVNMMPNWIPGKQRGKPVSVKYTLPIKFKLDDKVVEKIPPPSPPVEKEVFAKADEMPRFPGCEGSGLEEDELYRCAENEMLKFIYGNIKYPETARKKGIEGRAVVRFVVEKDGSISNIRILRELGGGCGEEVNRVIELMNGMPEKWIPGMKEGQPVRVQFTLPISFKLENGKKRKRRRNK